MSASKEFAGLKVLKLRGNDVKKGGAKFLGASQIREMEKLNLNMCKIGDDGI